MLRHLLDDREVIFDEKGMRVLRGETVIRSGDPVTAVTVLRKAISDNPVHPELADLRVELATQFSYVVDHAEKWLRYGFIQAQFHEVMALCRETQALRHLIGEGHAVINALQSSDSVIVGSALITIEHIQPKLVQRAMTIHRLVMQLQGGQHGPVDH